MRWTMLAVVAAVAVGCGGGNGSAETAGATSTTASTTTTMQLTRAQIGAQIVAIVDPAGQLNVYASNPERVAEIAAQVCADLRVSDTETVEDAARDSLQGLFVARGGPGSRGNPAAAGVMADLGAGAFVDAAVEVLCPDSGAAEFLPPN